MRVCLGDCKETFLGWSDKEPVGNGKLAEGARLFSKEDTVATAFPNGTLKMQSYTEFISV